MAVVPPFALAAGWPAVPGVHALVTLRHGAGRSRPPFDDFNLGNRSSADGDDPATVERNRAELAERLALPSWPQWLRQVHGTGVRRFDAPLAAPRAAGSSTGRTPPSAPVPAFPRAPSRGAPRG